VQMTMEAVCILKQEKPDWDTVSWATHRYAYLSHTSIWHCCRYCCARGTHIADLSFICLPCIMCNSNEHHCSAPRLYCTHYHSCCRDAKTPLTLLLTCRPSVCWVTSTSCAALKSLTRTTSLMQ
jgi:hypothetical protein